jgi:hypothetical protein
MNILFITPFKLQNLCVSEKVLSFKLCFPNRFVSPAGGWLLVHMSEMRGAALVLLATELV